MNYDDITEDVVTAVAIGGVTYLGSIGVTDPMIVGAIAGLGGYRMYKRRAVVPEE